MAGPRNPVRCHQPSRLDDRRRGGGCGRPRRCCRGRRGGSSGSARRGTRAGLWHCDPGQKATHGVFAGGQRITDGAVRGADRPDMVDGDGPSANAVAVSGSTSRSARAVWTHQPACPAGVRVDVASQSPVVRCPANCARRGYQRPGLAWTAASCWSGVDVQDRAFESWSRDHSPGPRPTTGRPGSQPIQDCVRIR